MHGEHLDHHLRRPNGFTPLRLALAFTVLVAHSWPLSGGTSPVLGDMNAGDIAVAAFFVISGYLITASRMALPLWQFATHRVLRIYPGFWTMLLVTGFALAPVLSLLTDESWTPASGLHFLSANWSTRMTDYTMAGTLQHTAYPPLWNGSAWTLWYEVLCYVAAALLVPLLARRRWVGVPVFVALFTLNVQVDDPSVRPLALGLHFGAWFAAGSLLRLAARRVPARPGIALLCAALALVTCAAGELDSFGALPFGYLVLWVAGATRSPIRTDLSYGVYLFAWPVQQALIDVGFLVTPSCSLWPPACSCSRWHGSRGPWSKGRACGWPHVSSHSAADRIPPPSAEFAPELPGSKSCPHLVRNPGEEGSGHQSVRVRRLGRAPEQRHQHPAR